MGAKPQTREEIHLGFIQNHRHLVERYCRPAGIPVSIALGMALRESAAGRSKLATEANNYFGIKADAKRWSGETYLKTDDEYDAGGNLIYSKFRKYPSVRHSFADFADFLRKGKNYSELFSLDPTDYVSWAHGLKSAGYATSPTYAEDLIRAIEKYQLYRFDALPSRQKQSAIFGHYRGLNNEPPQTPQYQHVVAEETPGEHSGKIIWEQKIIKQKKKQPRQTLRDKASKPTIGKAYNHSNRPDTMKKAPPSKKREKASSKTYAKRRAVK